MNQDIKTKLEKAFKKSKLIAFKLPEIEKREELLQRLLGQDLEKQERILELILRADDELGGIEEEAEKIKVSGIANMKKIVRDFRVKKETEERKDDLAELENLIKYL